MSKKNALDAADDLLDNIDKSLAKSAVDQVGEAKENHLEALKAEKDAKEARDKAAEFLAKAESETDETKKAGLLTAADTELAKAEEADELAKAHHELTATLIETAEDDLAKAEGTVSPWTTFAAEVAGHHQAVANELRKGIEDLKKKKDALEQETDSKLKATEDEQEKANVKAQADERAAGYGENINYADNQAKVSETFCKRCVYPQPEATLEKAMAMKDGRFPIQTAADVLRAMQAYQRVKTTDQPEVMAHIMNCAKALKVALPEGWHAPENLPFNRQPTSRVSEISQAEKDAAMAKGVSIVGPLAHMLGHIEALDADPAMEKMDADRAKKIQEWLDAGSALLKGAVVEETLLIADLDFQKAERVTVKAPGPWQSAASKALMARGDTNLSQADRLRRKELAGKLDAAADFFQKADAAEELQKAEKLQKADQVIANGGDSEALAKAATALEAMTAERDAYKVKLETVTDKVIPVVKRAQDDKTALRKAESTIAELEKKLKEAETKPNPDKGKLVGTDVVNKVDDGSGKPVDIQEELAAIPPAERSEYLLRKAHTLRGQEAERVSRRSKR